MADYWADSQIPDSQDLADYHLPDDELFDDLLHQPPEHVSLLSILSSFNSMC